MPQKQQPTANLRKLAAFAGFLLLLAIGISVLPKISERNHPFKGLFKDSSPAGDGLTLEPLFYKELGRYQVKDSAPAPADMYTVAIKVTSSRSEAEELVKALRSRNIEAYFTPMQRQGRVIYHVRSGVFPSEQGATRLAADLQKANYDQAKAVKLQ